MYNLELRDDRSEEADITDNAYVLLLPVRGGDVSMHPCASPLPV